VVNGREVRATVRTRRSAYTDKDRFAETDRFTGIGGIGNSSRLFCGSEDLVQMQFVNGDLTGIQLADPPGINICAHDLVAGFRKACAGD